MTNDEVNNTNTSAVNNDRMEINVEEITEVFDYISTALRTIEGFEKRFRKQINTVPIHTPLL